MKTFSLNAKMLVAVANAITPDETRYYLNGVFIQPVTDPETGKGVRFVATDGHILLAGYDPHSHASAPAILSMNFAAKALKPSKKDPADRYLRTKIERTETLTTGCVIAGADGDFMLDSIALHEVDGTFPAYERVIPEFKPKIMPDAKMPLYSFNPALIAKFTKAFTLLSTTDNVALTLKQKASGDPMAVTAESQPNLVGVLMPMRGDGRGRPEWLDYRLKQAQEKAA